VGEPVDRAIVTTFVTIPAAALTTSATAQPCTSYYVSGGYDRFTGATKAFSHFAPVAGSTVASIGAIIAPGKLDDIALVLQTISSNGLRYNGCYASYILADGKPVATAATSYQASVVKNGEVRQGSGAFSIPLRIPRIGWLGLAFGGSQTTTTAPIMLEQVVIQLGPEAVAQLGRASEIEFKTCNDAMVASYDFVQAAHEVACKVAQLSMRSGATPTPAPIGSPPALGPVTVEIVGKRLVESEQGPAFAWVLTVRNNTPGPIAVLAVVQLVDSEGFEVAHLAPEKLSVEASSERVFRGREPVAKEVADRVARLAVKLQVPAAQSTPVRPPPGAP
jgi:hypothetical protein